MWNAVLVVFALLFIVVTLLPLFPRDEWWIRALEFPRMQLVAVGLLGALLFLILPGERSAAGWVLWIGLLLCVAYHGYRIGPYTPLVPRQVVAAPPERTPSSISLLIANVLMDNRDAGRLLCLVREWEPDMVLLVETDAWWETRTQELERDYPFTVKEPLDNTYGMLLYSRLELIEPEVCYLVEDDIPSVHTSVRLPSGAVVRLHGLHPKPPAPQESERTTERDAELLRVGKTVASRDEPTIVAGDLNDVAWSDITRLFQKTSGLLDPRIGRGMFNTFNAKIPLLRWPLDHVFHSHDFKLIRMERLPAFGSDHFPVFVALSLDGNAPREQKEPIADKEDAEKAMEKMERAGQREAVP